MVTIQFDWVTCGQTFQTDRTLFCGIRTFTWLGCEHKFQPLCSATDVGVVAMVSIVCNIPLAFVIRRRFLRGRDFHSCPLPLAVVECASLGLNILFTFWALTYVPVGAHIEIGKA